jgi:ligand-binding SRPBCC domain-containing protein
MMKTYRLEKTIWLPQPRDKVFTFFAEPRNLDRLTPPWLNFSILTPAPAAIERGTLLDYRLRLRGIPIRWQSEITLWEPPYRFVDKQNKGPYSVWLHEHTFADRDRGTIVCDNVEYAVPGGAVVQRLWVAPDLERIFAYRHEILQALFNPKKLAPMDRAGV